MKLLIITSLIFLSSCASYQALSDEVSQCRTTDIIVMKSGKTYHYENVRIISREETHIVFLHTGRTVLHNGEYTLICNH
jgi:hypothetical protein